MQNNKKYRNQFPVLKKNKKLIYLDSGSTSLKPKILLDQIKKQFITGIFNDRASFTGDISVNDKVLNIRKRIANYLNLENSNEIVFTSGASESANLIAYGLIDLIEPDSEIILNNLEHSSNYVPWIIHSKTKKIKIINTPLNNDLVIDINKLKEIINEKTKIISLASTFSTTGSKNQLDEIVTYIRGNFPNIIIVLDITQTIGYEKMDLSTIDVDFAFFSSHKIFGPMGLGILWGKMKYLNQMKPIKYGGGNIISYDKDEIYLENPPKRFESGTKNISAILLMDTTLDFLEKTLSTFSYDYLVNLQQIIINNLIKNENVIVYNKNTKSSIVLFGIKNKKPIEVAEELAKYNIFVRDGFMCVDTISDTPLNTKDFVRVSLHYYNNDDDVNKFIQAINNITSNN